MTSESITNAVAGLNVSPLRLETLAIAERAGADAATLRTLARATRIRQQSAMVLPRGRYDRSPHGKGWCRKGTGSNATWAASDDDGNWTVGPGRWVVDSSVGFRRERITWVVKCVTVGTETWTVAN